MKICSLLIRLWPPVAEDFEQLWGEHDIAIFFAPLCVSKIYVAMAARRQWERTLAPVGGNITFAYESSGRSQESDEPWIGMPGLRRDVIWQIAERECFRFHFQVDLRVNMRGVQGDMPEPSPDGTDVHIQGHGGLRIGTCAQRDRQ